MSAGASALGTLLVQRLDAVLGTTLAQQANLMTGARSDAVSQAAQLARINPAQDATRTDLRHSVERVTQHADPRTTVRDARVKTASDADGRQTDGAHSSSTSSASSASTQLGSAARLILALLAQYPDRAPTAVGRQPLWQPPAPSASQAVQNPPGAPAAAPVAAHAVLHAATLARALGQTVATSGMFYESHLADLAFGKRSPEQLADEPQARLSGLDGPPVHGGALAALPTPEAALWVRQQLEVLAYQMFCWQGEAWPGAPMDWEIRRHDGEDADGDAQTWASRLKLTLPRLGDVQVNISLVGDALSMHLCAPDCADLLQRHYPALRERCEASGLALIRLSVDASDANDANGASKP